MIKISSEATIKQVKTAAEKYLELVKYEYCDQNSKEDYNYMQGLLDALQTVEKEFNMTF